MAQNKKLPTFLRPNEIDEANRHKQELVRAINTPDPDGRIQKASAAESIRRIDKRLEQAPPDLTPDQRTSCAKRIEELETELKEGMLSHEEMRRCPPGAVSQNIRWIKKNKHNVEEWKNRLLALNKGIPSDEATDMLNIDRLRPYTSRLNMDGAVIPQTTSRHFMGDAWKSTHPAAASYEDIFPSGDPEKDALKKANAEKEAELAALKAQLAAAQQRPSPNQNNMNPQHRK